MGMFSFAINVSYITIIFVGKFILHIYPFMETIQGLPVISDFIDVGKSVYRLVDITPLPKAMMIYLEKCMLIHKQLKCILSILATGALRSID